MTESNLVQSNYVHEQEAAYDAGPVTCLGMQFPNDEARRAYFTDQLREHLRDPLFRAIEGFPIGEDEAILALSDPPYYTACPNPFLPQIIEEWQQERSNLHSALNLVGAEYHREPFAADVSEGKSDSIYSAHSYHTKVPHKAVMRYILHYTEPGDIVFDGFCGSGMTGVAAQLCGDRKAVQELGYTVDDAGNVYAGGQRISRVGSRRVVLNDLSPAATFIAYNYNTPVDVTAFEREAKGILDSVKAELGWMYETWHPDCDALNRVKARISYTVWSEVFGCPNCGAELVYLKAAFDVVTKRVADEFSCPECGRVLSKRSVDKVLVNEFDAYAQEVLQSPKRVPVLVEYQVNGTKYMREVDSEDIELINRIGTLPVIPSFPHDKIPYMHMTHERSRMDQRGVTSLHHLFMPRPRNALNALWARAQAVSDNRLRAFLVFAVEQSIWGMSLLNRYGPTHFSQVNRYLTGVYYVSSLISEVSPWYILTGKTQRLASAFGYANLQRNVAAVTTQSTTASQFLPGSLDYIFTDPPFGENIYYADLNFLVESWHQVRTQSKPEAIIDQAKRKTLSDYRDLMRDCFANYYAALKPGCWMTVEFHNSHDSVWRAIQEALTSVGFVVADVRTLDKQQESYRQVTSGGAKQDLIISAYKPAAEFEQLFALHAGTDSGVWEFVSQHLDQVPRVVRNGDRLETVAERQNFLLFDRMVAYHIQRGVGVPMGSAQFYAGLKQHFVERDGMYFLPEQVAEYDRARLTADAVEQISLFVNDEKSAITWLRVQLNEQPQTFQEVQPNFLRELHQARHEDLPDLHLLLEQNFLQDGAGRYYVPDPANAEDLEKLRRKALLQEFATYRQARKRLKVFRTEAVRAGFAQAYADNDFAVITEVAALLPEIVVQEDPELLMYVDAASLRA
jgi:predicted RNA-binding Zn-ribbon protein involved in translation (DUF1610 family)